jgi:hypothetical protein
MRQYAHQELKLKREGSYFEMYVVDNRVQGICRRTVVFLAKLKAYSAYTLIVRKDSRDEGRVEKEGLTW